MVRLSPVGGCAINFLSHSNKAMTSLRLRHSKDSRRFERNSASKKFAFPIPAPSAYGSDSPSAKGTTCAGDMTPALCKDEPKCNVAEKGHAGDKLNSERKRRMKILLVEDDAKIAAFVAKGLRDSGYVVDQSGNGEDGMRAGPQKFLRLPPSSI